jgi:hypothetical protein
MSCTFLQPCVTFRYELHFFKKYATSNLYLMWVALFIRNMQLHMAFHKKYATPYGTSSCIFFSNNMQLATVLKRFALFLNNVQLGTHFETSCTFLKTMWYLNWYLVTFKCGCTFLQEMCNSNRLFKKSCTFSPKMCN